MKQKIGTVIGMALIVGFLVFWGAFATRVIRLVFADHDQAAMNYVGFLFEDGDCDNDWLTHMNDNEAIAWKTWAQEHGLCDQGNHNGLVRKTFTDGAVLITPCKALTCTYVVNGGILP